MTSDPKSLNSDPTNSETSSPGSAPDQPLAPEQGIPDNIVETIVLEQLAKQDPFSLIEEGFLFIKTKTGELVPLVLNKAQKKLLGIIKKMWIENKIIRILILKARQLGSSTLCEAIIFAITSQQENINSTIIADDLDGSNYIFEMSKLFYEKMPRFLKPAIKKSNEKKLEFEGTHSQIIIDTAENPDAGRKFT